MMPSPESRMTAFKARFGTSTPQCPYCGGSMQLTWDEHQPIAKCWTCGREIPETPMPPIDTIESFEPTYYQGREESVV